MSYAMLADLEIADPDGKTVRVGDLVDRPTLLVLTRYYGCLPCRDYLDQVDRAYDSIEAVGAQAISVGTGADFQAKALMDGGLRVRCFIDAASRTYRALEIKRSSWLGLLKPAGLRRYLASFHRGARQGRLTGDIRQMPGLAVLDQQARAVWVHRGETLGDYPALEHVLARLATMV